MSFESADSSFVVSDFLKYCSTYPSKPKMEVSRRNIINLIKDSVSDKKLLVVTGVDGSGKTTLLRQFYDSEVESTFAYFAGINSNRSNLNDVFIQLGQQILFFLGKTEREIADFKSLRQDELASKFDDIYRELSRFSTRYTKNVYIIVDGFENIYGARETNGILNSTLLSPSGKIHIILTGSNDLEYSFNSTQLRIMHLSYSEIAHLYSDLDLTKEQIHMIADSSPGIPSQDMVAIRLLRSGVPLESIVANFRNNLSAFFDREWDLVENNDQTKSVISLIVSSHGDLSIEEICSLTNVDFVTCLKICESTPFISNELGKPIICPASYRPEITKKISDLLVGSKIKIRDLYSTNISNYTELQRLANFLSVNEEEGLLSSIVSLDKIENIIKASGDIVPIRSIADSVANTLFLEKRWDPIFDFSLLSSVTETVNRFLVNEFEFNSYLHMKKFEEAHNLTDQILIKEEKLKYRCLIYAEMQKTSENISQTLIDDLVLLEELIPSYSDVSNALRIGASAYSFSRDLALNIFKKALGDVSTDKYIEAARSRLALQIKSDTYDVLGSVPEDENMEGFVRSRSMLGENFVFSDLKREVQATSDTSASILLIINWCTVNKEAPETRDAIELSLEVMYNSSQYQPAIRTLRQLSEFYKKYENWDDAIYDKFSAIVNSIEHYPLEEYYRYKINLGIHKLKSKKDYDYWLDLYSEIDSIDDLDSRTFVLSHMILDYQTNMDNDEIGFILDATESLKLSFKNMLDFTAEHSEISRSIIDNVLQFDLQLASDFALSLNTFQRRDYAITRVVDFASKNIKTIEDIRRIQTLCSKLLDTQKRDSTLLRSISNAVTNTESSQLPFIGEIFRDSDKMKHSPQRVNVEIIALKFNANKDEKRFKASKDKINDLIPILDSSWLRTRFLFAAAEALLDVDNDTSHYFLERAKQESSDSQFGSYEFSQFYQNYMYIICKSIGSVTVLENHSEIFQQLMRQIAAIPSLYSRCELLSHLYVSSYELATPSALSLIIKEMKAIIDDRKFEGDRSDLITQCACPIFLNNSQEFEVYINDIDICYRDEALSQVLNFLMLGKLSGEIADIYDTPGKINRERYLSICGLIEKLTFDFNITTYSEKLLNAIIRPNNASKSKESKSDEIVLRDVKFIESKFRQIKTNKLPDAYNILHSGYSIEMDIYIKRINNSLNSFYEAPKDYREIVDKIDSEINNISDKVYLYLSVAENSRIQDQNYSERILQQAVQMIPNIPSALDRAGRSLHAAKIYKRSNLIDTAKDMMRFSVEYLRNTPYGQRNDTITKNILSLAHSIEPDYASSLIAVIENPAHKHFDELSNIAKNVAHSPNALKDLKRLNYLDRKYAIGQLGEEMFKGLVSGRINTKIEKDAAAYLVECLGVDMSTSFPMYAWHINNSVSLRKSSLYFKDRISSLSNILDMTAHTLGIQRNYHRKILPSGQSIELGENSNVVFFPTGSSDLAENFLREWVRNNKSQSITIYDPYFNLETIRIMSDCDTQYDKQIKIYTLLKAHKGVSADTINSLQTLYRSAIDHYFPNGLGELSFEVQVVGGHKTGDGPMHDRFIHSQEMGLDLSGSLDGIGLSDNKIIKLESQLSQALFDRYIPSITTNLKYEYKGERLLVRRFNFDRFS